MQKSGHVGVPPRDHLRNMKEIVYLIDQPLDQRNYDRFGIQVWIDRGWNVILWDLTKLSHPGVYEDFILNAGNKIKTFKGYFNISNLSDADHHLYVLKNSSYFIDLTEDNANSIKIKRQIAKMGSKRVVLFFGTVPEPKHDNFLVRMLKKIWDCGLIQFAKFLFNKLILEYSKKYLAPSLFVVSGERSISPDWPKSKILRAHNFDYDLYLKLKNTVTEKAQPFIVFIDQDYCFHTDFLILGRPSLTDPKKYYPAICNVLRIISNELNAESCVAVHPRSNHQIGNYFEAIPLKYGATAELIKNCEAVVGHDSTAIQLAILFLKPIIIVTTDDLEKMYEGLSIKAFAAALDKSVINIDKDLSEVDWQKELSVNFEKYSDYKKLYIKTAGSPEKLFWDIVVDYIDQDF